MEPTPGRAWALVSLALGLAVLNAWLCADAVLYSRNTLLHNGRWISGKRMLQMGITGGDSFILTRTALSRDRLNLKSWLGFNEVWYSRPVALRELGFDFYLEKDAYLEVLFDGSSAGYAGLRLSRNPRRPSVFFRSDTEGRFISTRTVAAPIEDGGWHRVRLGIEDGRFVAGLDGREVLSAEGAPLGERNFGFRSGFKAAAVDDVRFIDRQGRTFLETFANDRGRLRTFLQALLLTALALACQWAWGGLRARGSSALIRACALSFVLASCAGILFAFDFWGWSRLNIDSISHPLRGPAAPEFRQRLDAARRSVFELWSEPGWEAEGAVVRAMMAQGYPRPQLWFGPVFFPGDAGAPPALLSSQELEKLLNRKKTAARVLFVGTSQTEGAGALRLDETFVARVHMALAESLGPSRPIEILNEAESGSMALRQLFDYRRLYIRFKPDLVVINLSNNDAPDTLQAGLEGFLTLNRDKHIPTILLKEANSDEFVKGAAALARNHGIVEAVARRFGVPCYDLHGFLNDPKVAASGRLWWDMVHLSSYGQALAAEWLEPKLEAQLGIGGRHAQRVRNQ